MSLNVQGDDYNTPTNPQLISTAADFSDGDRIYTAITSHGGVSLSISGWGGAVTEYSNLHTTKGFRIKCYDALTTDGIRFNPNAQNLIDNDYFVLLYSDTPFQHHFAKITEVITEDIEGDAFEFSPKLGNEIPKDTKFIIFQMGKDTDVIAVSLGLLQDSTPTEYIDQLARRMVVGRPLFYFYPGLDKEGELNHNVKYYAMRECGTANSYTLDNTDPAITFITRQDFGKTITDYSKYSHRVTLTDTLRTLDETNTATNEGLTGLSSDTTDYDATYRNARRIADDIITTPTYTGPSRYLHYDFSPLKANVAYNVYEHTHTESIDGKGGFAETSIIDSARIMPKKVKEFAEYRVRQDVHRGELNAFFSVKATYSSNNSAYAFVFDIEYDLRDVLNAGDEIKCGSDFYLVELVAAPSGKTQQVSLKRALGIVLSRTATESEFTLKASKTPAVGDVLERRAYSAQDNTLMLDTHLLNGRFSKLYVAFSSLNLSERFASVTACDATIGMITLTFSDDAYSENPLSYTDGNYVLYIERFNGEVENIESRKEDNQTIMTLQGRDKFSKLLSPVVNLNTLFSEDIIYSSNSPYNKLVVMDGRRFDIALGDTELETDIQLSDFSNPPDVGDHLFTTNGYIGKVTGREIYFTYPRFNVRLLFSGGAMTEADNDFIYVSKEKNYIFAKALGANHLATNKPTSLTGSANKGIFFTAGNEINSDGTEGNSLVGSSVNTSEGAIGYSINKPSSISNDLAFQSKLHDEYGSADPASFDTVNTLIDFEVVSVTKKDNTTEIELAPYIPITLGRKADYYFDDEDYTFTEIGAISEVTPYTTSKDWYFFLDDYSAYDLKRDDILFVGDSSSTTTSGTKNFIGKVIEISIYTNSATNRVAVSLDREYDAFTVGEKIYSVSKNSSELIFVNGKHLWGGRITTLPHPKTHATLGIVSLNVENSNGDADTNSKHGQMYYKSKDFATGTFESEVKEISTISTNTKYTKTHNNVSLLNYITSNYQFKPNIAADNLIAFDTTDSSYRTFPLDLRGHRTPYGGTTTSTRIHRSENIHLVKEVENTLAELSYGFQDNSAERLFLYITSDLLPYSSTREDSLMNGNFNVNNYNLFLIENQSQKDSSLISANRVSLKDSNFQTLNFSTDVDISTLKRFGLMRLTEVCVDFMFNKINPEKPINDTDNTFGSLFIKLYDIQTLTNDGAIDTISGTTITFNDNQTIAADAKIYDSDGYFIGETSTAGTNVKSFTLKADAYLTGRGSAASNAIVVGVESVDVFGRNGRGTFDEVTAGVHPLKVCVIPEGSTYITGAGTSDELILPIAFDTADTATITAADAANVVRIANFIPNINDDQMQGLVGVSLDRFSIENGGRFPIEKGSTSQALYGLSTVTSNSKLFLTIKAYEHFKQYENVGDTTDSYITSSTYAVDGSFMAFKLRLSTPFTLTESDIKSSNGDVKKTTLTSNGDGAVNNFLRLVDITGCYLVPEVGKSTDGTTITTGSFASSKRMNNVAPDELIYVISHEVDSADANQHFIVTDVGFTADTTYRVLQPNETCIYDFFPSKINLNVLSSSYTKVSGENKTYQTKNSYSYQHGKFANPNGVTDNEGILSMYVVIDTDKQSTDTGLVLKDPSNFIDSNLPDGEYSLIFSDGDNKKKIEVTTSTDSDDFVSINMKESFYGKGIVSVSEPFLVSSNQELKINPTRACIGSTVSIGLEGEDLINELLEQEGIEFETTGTDVPLYLAPNYQGVDLYSAIRYVLDRKEMKLVEENNVFKIIPDDEDAYYTDITIDDSGDYLIQDFEKVSTLFDFYNEIIVYGNAHKATRKDIRSMQKRGRKTLEVVDGSLLTQEEVDKQAQKLLRIHSKLNQKLTLTMSSRGINQLRPGDIVNVEITRENIELSEYIVLQMEHNITGFMKLELGRYSKDLSDVFSELLVSSKQTKAALRSSSLVANEISYNFLNTLDTKELKLLVRKREASDGATLGFGSELNTGTTELGFEGGATIVLTEILEEDLA